MIDATKLLDQFLGAGSGGRAKDLLGQIGGQFGLPGAQQPGTSVPTTKSSAVPASGGSDLLGRAQDMLRGSGSGFAGGAAATAIAGLLLGSKSGRKMAMGAAKLGAVAILGGLAYKAYTNYRDGRPILPGAGAIDLGSSPLPALPGAPPLPEHATLLLRAMIAAATSDGVVDASERHRIVGQLDQDGISAEEQAFLEEELGRPWSPAQLAGAVSTPEMRSEIYLASVLAIDCDTEAERAYLRYLAAAFGLDDKLVAHLSATAEAAKEQAKAA